MKNFDTKNIKSGRSLLPICEVDAPAVLSAVDDKKSISEKTTSRYPQSGRSMIEMLGVLAIIGVLSVGGIAGYSKAMTKYRINKTIEQITLIAGNVRTFFGRQKNYTEVFCQTNNSCTDKGCSGYIPKVGIAPEFTDNGCPIVKKAKIYPDETLTLDSTGKKIMSVNNAFGYGIDLGYASITKGDRRAFKITYYIGNNNPEACIELLTHDWTIANVKVICMHIDAGWVYIKTPVAFDLAVEKCSNITIAKNWDWGYGIAFYFDTDVNGTAWQNTKFLN